jgi:hypothetical protein
MEYNNNDVLNDKNQTKQAENKANATRVDDDSNLKESNLERNLYGKSENNMNPVKEGQPMGGENFGKNSNTAAGDDKNNPSQNAGYTNAYFARTEPSEEHPEDSNFKAKDQDGAPDYDSAQPRLSADGDPKPEEPKRGNGDNYKPHTEQPYQEGTVDNEKEPNIPGPNELPDQLKVGENPDGRD